MRRKPMHTSDDTWSFHLLVQSSRSTSYEDLSISMKIFSTMTGEIDKATGELNRLAIKKQNKNIIDGMYKGTLPSRG